MSTPEGHSMTTIEDTGGTNGPETTPVEKDNNTQPVEAGDAGSNGGGEDQTVGEDAGQEESQFPADGDGTEANAPLEDTPQPEQFDPNAFKDEILKSIEERIKPPEPPPAQMTEEQWSAKEQETGVPRTAIQFFTHQAMTVYNKVMEQMEARFAKLDKAENLQSLSHTPGYEDALRYSKGVDTFLSDYDPRHHSNPELLKRAVIYARGLASGKNIQRVRTETERNRRIVSTARPASPGSASGASRHPNTANVSLNATQKEVASKFNMSESEYKNLRATRGKPIAV